MTKKCISHLLRENQNYGVEKRAKRFSQLLHFRHREGEQKSKCTLQILCLIMFPCIANIDIKGKPSVMIIKIGCILSFLTFCLEDAFYEPQSRLISAHNIKPIIKSEFTIAFGAK